jgi:hypothetical protein
VARGQAQPGRQAGGGHKDRHRDARRRQRGAVAANLGELYDRFVTGIEKYEPALKCGTPAAVGAWTPAAAKPAPLAPRKATRLTFKGVPVPTTPGDGGSSPYHGRHRPRHRLQVVAADRHMGPFICPVKGF